MTREEILTYLANVAMISAVDGQLSPLEAKAIEAVRQEIDASKNDLNAALQAVARGDYQIRPAGRLSEKIRNLEDMVFVSLADGDLSKAEKPEILSFAKAIKINQNQLTQILSEAKNRLKTNTSETRCPTCGKGIPPESKFCPLCGASITVSQ